MHGVPSCVACYRHVSSDHKDVHMFLLQRLSEPWLLYHGHGILDGDALRGKTEVEQYTIRLNREILVRRCKARVPLADRARARRQTRRVCE